MAEEIAKVSYCVGMSVAGSLIQQDLDKISTEDFLQGMKDVIEGKDLKYNPNEANQLIQEYLDTVNESKFVQNKTEGEEFLAENAKKSGISQTDSGLQYQVLVEGNGPKPSAADTVKVHYHGTLIDGSVFDSSVERDSPASFGVTQVIRGWTEALQLMNVGSKYKLFIPQDLAYGTSPHPGGPIKPYMALIFDVELLEII